jgi:hypothetical protein
MVLTAGQASFELARGEPAPAQNYQHPLTKNASSVR